MSALKMNGNICTRCNHDLTKAIDLFGFAETMVMHKLAHSHADLEKLLEKWKPRLDPEFLKELNEVLT